MKRICVASVQEKLQRKQTNEEIPMEAKSNGILPNSRKVLLERSLGIWNGACRNLLPKAHTLRGFQGGQGMNTSMES